MNSIEVARRRAFSETCDPSAYVPREATEAALAAIRAWGGSDEVGSSVAALVGTPGLGKTQLLRVIESQVNGGAALSSAQNVQAAQAAPALSSAVRPSVAARALYLPYAGLALPDLAIWVHGLLGRTPARVADIGEPDVALEALLELGGGPTDPFLLIFDDADAMPAETVQALIKGLPRSASPLRILITLNPDSKATRLFEALYPLLPTEISFRTRMNVDETGTYVRERMRWGGFPGSEIAGIDESEAMRIHTLSGGVPRRVHEIASARFESAGDARPTALEDKARREDWMGRPIEDDLEV